MKKSKIGEHILKYCVIVLGALIFATGFQLFMYPNNIISGGVTGVAMIINKLSRLPVGVLTIVLNIPLFVLAWKKFGLRFIVDSLVGMLLSSIFVDLLAIPNIVATTEPLLASIIGGVLKGLGLGMIYWEGATTGGSDIVAKLVRKRYPYINFGTIVLVLDAVIIVAFAIIFNDWQAAMYSVIGMFVESKLIDLVLYGTDLSYMCYIVSDHGDDISAEITRQLDRGVTIIRGEGGYTHAEKQILMCAVKRTQSVEIRKIAKSVDQDAFMIVTEAKNVFGNGFGNISDIS